jgi:3-hydroxy-9,10-secoandrosta-1,3,5(10)-triene-9,17-dione monooxygenase
MSEVAELLPSRQVRALVELVDGSRRLVPQLRERRHEADTLRRLPEETVRDLRALGVLDMAVPHELGGPDLGADGILEISIELARGCAASAWCAGNWAVHNLLAAMFPTSAQDEIFVDGQAPVISTGFSPLRAKTRRIDGGAILNGRWDFVSGVDHADHIVLVGVGESGAVAHLVPRADITIIDTWHTAGLRGTGSQDVDAANVFVPEHRLSAMEPISSGRSLGRQLYVSPFLRLPLSTYFGCAVIGTVLGTAVGAIEVFTQRTSEKIGGLSGIKAATRPEVHLRLGEAAAEVDAALLITRSTYAEMRAAGTSGSEIPALTIAQWRRNVGWSAKTATAAVARLYEAGGAHVLYDTDQLQQFYRDINAGSHHYGVAWDALFSSWARTSLGLEG